MEILLSRQDVMVIPAELCPMPLLSDNLRSFFSWGIKEHEEGNYNHYMWLIRPGIVISQGLFFKEEQITDYFDKCRLKFWYCPGWTPEERKKIINAMEIDLKKPWYERIYDVPAIVGQLFHCDWFQTPGVDICSDKGKYLKITDSNYDLFHPDPEEVNRWLMKYPDKYKVYGRYVPD